MFFGIFNLPLGTQCQRLYMIHKQTLVMMQMSVFRKKEEKPRPTNLLKGPGHWICYKKQDTNRIQTKVERISFQKQNKIFWHENLKIKCAGMAM